MTRVSCTWLLVLVAVLLVRPSHSGIVFYSTPQVVLVIWPSSQWPVLQPALQLAANDFASLWPVNVTFSYVDSGSLAPTTVVAMLKQHYALPTQIVAVIGTSDDLSSVQLINVCGALTLPVFQVASYSTALTVSGGTMIRTAYPFTAYGEALNLVMARQNWTYAAVFHTLDMQGLELSNYLLQNPVTPNATYHIYALPSNSALALPAVYRALSDIASKGLRVVIVHGSQAATVLASAGAQGLMQSPYTWIGTTWCRDPTVTSLLDPAWLTGVICVDASQNATAYAAFQARAGGTALPFWTTYAYDAVGALAYAMNAQQVQGANVTASSKVTALLKVLSTVAFNGSVAPFRFPSSTATDRVGFVDILNYRADAQTFATVASHTQSAPNLTLNDVIIYSNGNAYGQADLAGVYYPEEALIWSRDSRLSILAYVVSVLGFWVLLLLIEQALSARRKSLIIGLSSPLALRRRVTLAWVGWASLGGVVAGVVGVWMPLVIQLCGISVDSYTWTLDPSAWVETAAIAVAAVWAGVFVTFLGLQPHSPWLTVSSQRTDTSSRTDPTSQMTHATATQQNAPSAPTDTNHRDSRSGSGASVSPLQQSMLTSKTHATRASINTSTSSKSKSTSSTAWGTTNVYSRLLLLRLHWMMEQLLSWRLLVCSVAFGGGVVLCHWRLWRSVDGPIDALAVDGVVGAFFLAWLVSWWPWWLLFHWHRSVMRFVVAFMLAALVWGTNELLIARAHAWTYDSSVGANGTGDAPGLLAAVVLAVVGVVVCALALLLNVVHLKMTQRALRRYMRDIQRKLDDWEQKQKVMDARLMAVERQVRLSQGWIRLITQDRPVSRPHAQIMAVAGHHETLALQCLRTNHLPAYLLAATPEEQAAAGGASPVTAAPVATTAITGSPVMAGRHGDSVSVSVQTLTLDELLENPYGLELLRDVLEAKLTPENLMFYCAVQLLRQVNSTAAGQVLVEEILDLYINDGAPYEVNINHQMRNQLVQKLKSENNDPVKLLDPVIREVLSLIQTNDLQRCVQHLTAMQKTLLRAKP